MKGLPPLNALHAFETAARHGSFKLAAEEFCVTQGAISRHILGLENTLGVRLFLRRHRKVELTEAGAAYRIEIRAAFDLIERATTALTYRDDAMLRVKVPPTCAVRWFVPRLGQFEALHPGITVQVTTSHIATNFDREAVDVAIQYNRSADPHLTSELLFGEDLVPICTRELAARNGGIREPKDLGNHVLLKSILRPSDWPRWFDAAGIPQQLMPKRELVLENASLTYEGAEKGLGVALAQRAFITDELLSGRLIVPIDRNICNDTGYYLVFPKDRARARKVKAFRDWLASEAQAIASSPDRWDHIA